MYFAGQSHRLGLPTRKVCLVDPNPTKEYRPTLEAINYGKNLWKPIKASFFGISVIKQRCPYRVELEYVNQESHSFWEGYLPRIEYRPSKRVELSPTALALHDYKSRFLWSPILPYWTWSAAWAEFYWYGVYELNLLFWWLAMLCFTPLGNGRDHHPRRSQRIRKLGLQGLFLVFVFNLATPFLVARILYQTESEPEIIPYVHWGVFNFYNFERAHTHNGGLSPSEKEDEWYKNNDHFWPLFFAYIKQIRIFGSDLPSLTNGGVAGNRTLVRRASHRGFYSLVPAF